MASWQCDIHVTLFNNAAAFNQPLNNWNVSNVSSMCFMFNSAKSFNQPLDNWDVSKVVDMTCMFCDAAAFNQPIFEVWKISNSAKTENMLKATKCSLEHQNCIIQ